MLPLVNQRDLGVGADVHDQAGLVAGPEVLRGEQRGDMVAADEAADVGRDMHIGAGADRQAELARLDVHRLAHRGDEGRAAELATPAGPAAGAAWPCCRRPPRRRCPRGAAATARHRSWASALIAVIAASRSSSPPPGCADGVVDPADHVGAPGDLRVLDGEAGQALAAFAGRSGKPPHWWCPGRPPARGWRCRAPRRRSVRRRAGARAATTMPRAQHAGAAAAARPDRARRSWPGRARRSRSTSLAGSARLARCAGCRSTAPHQRVERQRLGARRCRPRRRAPPAPASAARLRPCSPTRRATGRRAAISCGRRALAGSRPRGVRAALDLAVDDWTAQVPQVPRPPQAPTMRTPLRRALWNKVSPACGGDDAIQVRKAQLWPGGAAATRDLRSWWAGFLDGWRRSGRRGRGERPRAHAAFVARVAGVAARPGACGQVHADAQHHRGRLERVHQRGLRPG